MSVQPAARDYYTFTAGLNTEGGYFTQPPNTWREGDNVIPNIDGSLSKRTCIDYEQLYSLTTTNYNNVDVKQWAFVAEEWTAVAGDGSTTFFVVQTGRFIHFYNSSTGSISATKKSFTIDLDTYKSTLTPNPIGVSPIQVASANGKLIICSRDTKPMLVTYTTATDTIAVELITINIRDFEGLSDALRVDERPSTLSKEHEYNLKNQGWSSTQYNAYKTAKSVYPSNAQSWYHGKNTSDDFDSSMLDKQDFGTSPAPKGRYILDVFNRDRTTASGVASITTETETYRPSTVAFFAGRAWFAGVKSNKIGSWVMFSQVATDSSKYGKCHQDADPTSEVISDLIDNDGGVISIQDIGEITALVPFNNSILVFGTNGVWQIVGTSNSGFNASNYEVNKVSSYGCRSPKSVVIVEGAVFYWSDGGVYVIGGDSVSGVKNESLTDLNIRSFYASIPALSKTYAQGVYNTSSKLIYWLYRDELSDVTDRPYLKNRVLAMDLRLKCFYTFSFGAVGSVTPYVVSVAASHETSSTETTADVYAVTDDVNASTDDIVVTYPLISGNVRTFKFLTLVPSDGGSTWNVTFSDMDTTNNAPAKWHDWYTYNSTGIGYSAYLITGYDVAPNGPSRKKTPMYLSAFMKRTETALSLFNSVNSSKCYMSVRWDFTDLASTGKWSDPVQVYRHLRPLLPNDTTFDTGYPLVVTKNKLLGRGKALQVKFEADEDYDMQLVGWSTIVTGATHV